MTWSALIDKAISRSTVLAGVGLLGVVSVLIIVLKPMPGFPADWLAQGAVFVATATVPVFIVEFFARTAARIGEHLDPTDHTQWFANPGAFLGMFERILYLGSMVGGHPALIAIWFGYKGISGWRQGGGIEKPEKELQSGRRFQLLLLNNAVSLASAGMGWMVWMWLRLPVLGGP